MTNRVSFIATGLSLVGLAGWASCDPPPGPDADADLSRASLAGQKTAATAASQVPKCEVLQGGKVNTGPLPEGCAKIEGGQIGQPGIEVEVDDVEVTFSAWQEKTGETGEYIGFTYTASSPVCVSVKAGKDRFVAEKQGSWTHPSGTSGPRAHAISNVVICVPDEPAGGGGDDTCPCGTRTCGPAPTCEKSCGTCPAGYLCTPLGYCAIYQPH